MPFVEPDDLARGEPLPGWAGRFFSTAGMTFATYEVAADAQPLHEHRHPQEEVWTVLEGELAFTIDGLERVVGPGAAAVIPSGVPHSARPLGQCRALVVDQPPRAEVGGVKIPTAVDEPGET